MKEIKYNEIGSIIIDNYHVDDLIGILLTNEYVVQIENIDVDNKLITIKKRIKNNEMEEN